MLLAAIVAPLLAAQVVFEGRPVPPPPPAPGSEGYRSEVESYRRDLAAQCFSPAGIDIILAAREPGWSATASGPPEWRIHSEAVARAAWAQPFDAEAFAKAIRAEAAYRARREVEVAEANLATIAALSGRDREIYAHRMTPEVRQGYVKPF